MVKPNTSYIGEIRDALAITASTYSGEALFAPSPTEMTKTLRLSKGMLYHYGGGIGYDAVLEQVTGLKVIHKAIVLGDPNMVKGPEIADITVAKAERAIQELSPAARALLLQKLMAEEIPTE